MAWSDELAKRSDALRKVLADDAEFIGSDSALPRWVKLLMAMQLDSVTNHPDGARYYGTQALEAGASEQQVMEAIQLLRMYAGRPAMATAASMFLSRK